MYLIRLSPDDVLRPVMVNPDDNVLHAFYFGEFEYGSTRPHYVHLGRPTNLSEIREHVRTTVGPSTEVIYRFPSLNISPAGLINAHQSHDVRITRIAHGQTQSQQHPDTTMALGDFLLASDSPLPLRMFPVIMKTHLPPGNGNDAHFVHLYVRTNNSRLQGIRSLATGDSLFATLDLGPTPNDSELNISLTAGGPSSTRRYSVEESSIGCRTLMGYTPYMGPGADAFAKALQSLGTTGWTGGAQVTPVGPAWSSAAKYGHPVKKEPEAKVAKEANSCAVPSARVVTMRQDTYYPGEIVKVRSKSRSDADFGAVVLAISPRSDPSAIRPGKSRIDYIVYALRSLKTNQADWNARERWSSRDPSQASSKPDRKLVGISEERILGRSGTIASGKAAHGEIGVVLMETLEIDGRVTLQGAYGVVRIPKHPVCKLPLCCLEVTFVGPGPVTERTQKVPVRSLALCELRRDAEGNLQRGTVFATLQPLGGEEVPATKEFSTGDIVYYSNPSPWKAAGIILLQGTLLRCASDFLSNPDFNGVVILLDGKPAPEGKETKIALPRKMISRLPHTWLEKGTSVEIKASIMFKRQDLLGRKGKVTLSTDIDGDVGVEFPEEIQGAGSLDGVGKNGHCLFVPAAALREVAE